MVRTRKSTRNKRFVFEKYDFDDSSDEVSQRQEGNGSPSGKDGTAGAAAATSPNSDADVFEDNPEDDDFEAKPSEDDDQEDMDAISLSGSSRDGGDVVREGGGSVQVAGTRDPNAIDPFVLSKTVTRAYEGPLKKQRKTPYVLDYMFGPDSSHLDVASDMLNRFYRHDVKPGKPVDETSGPMPSPWVADGFEARQAVGWRSWMKRYSERKDGWKQRWFPMGDEEVKEYWPNEKGDLAMMYGPYGDQQEFIFRKNKFDGITLSGSDLPPGEIDEAAKGWVIDTGGIVLSLAWAPRSTTGPQVLAACVVPHADQESPKKEERDSHKGSRKRGIIQLWRFSSESEDIGSSSPANETPIMFRAFCFEWGRARRVKWCPVPSTNEEILGLLAVLTGDGIVRVLEVASLHPDEQQNFKKMTIPMFTLDIPNEHGVEATAFAWANTNRIVVGYRDGSIALWSLHPQMMLSRHPIHTTYVLDVVTGYPSRPYLVASTPTAGLPTLVDMSCPSYETTSFARKIITTQPNLLQWNDLMQGFFICHPSGSMVETAVSFVHHRYFPVIKRVIDTPSLLTCLASGYTHPFLLVGLKDGSVWTSNALKKTFATKVEKPKKQKLFDHEYKPAMLFHNPEINKTKDRDLGKKHESLRGAARILQGWKVEDNNYRFDQRKAPPRQKKPSTKKKRRSAVEMGDIDMEELPDATETEDDDMPMFSDPRPLVNHEPFTRIMVMEWNPNLDCGTWAAVGMASGLVRVMDLGTEA